MAEKRMLSSQIIGSDAFLDLPLTAQALYMHLNINADDDGFINSPKRVQRMIGASESDLNLLYEKRFLLRFESGAAVIKHWFINNTIRNDRKKGTVYTDELAQLKIKPNGAYTLANDGQSAGNRRPIVKQTAYTCQPNDNQLTTKPQPIVNQTATNCQPNDRINKDNLKESNLKESNLKESNLKPFDHRSDDHAPEEPEIVTTIEKRFEEFWNLYPRKVGKLKAFQSFKRINPNKELFDNMMEALRENIASNAQWKRDNGQYIPHPTTWLNQGRWFDEISTDAPGAGEDFFMRALKGEVDY